MVHGSNVEENHWARNRRAYWCAIFFGILTTLVIVVTSNPSDRIAGLAVVCTVSLLLAGSSLGLANLVAGRWSPDRADAWSTSKRRKGAAVSGNLTEILSIVAFLVALVWFFRLAFGL